jgi:hypothetical protein
LPRPVGGRVAKLRQRVEPVGSGEADDRIPNRLAKGHRGGHRRFSILASSVHVLGFKEVSASHGLGARDECSADCGGRHRPSDSRIEGHTIRCGRNLKPCNDECLPSRCRPIERLLKAEGQVGERPRCHRRRQAFPSHEIDVKVQPVKCDIGRCTRRPSDRCGIERFSRG